VRARAAEVAARVAVEPGAAAAAAFVMQRLAPSAI
jgi:hypothetical protein